MTGLLVTDELRKRYWWKRSWPNLR